MVITYLLGRRWKVANYISWPVAFGAMSLVPPATGVNFSSWWAINVIFNGLLRHRKPAWWSKYSMYCLPVIPFPLGPMRVFSMLIASRLCSVCRTGLWRSRINCNHILLHHSPCRASKLVGKYCVHSYRRWQRYTLQEHSCAWLLWAIGRHLELGSIWQKT